MRIIKIICLVIITISLVNCKKKDDSNSYAKIVFKLKFDSTQARLNNIGQLATIAAGRAAQSPKFNTMSAHYIELAPNAFTALGSGAILYHAPEVTTGGSTAIDFSKSIKAGNLEDYFSAAIKDISPGTYEYIRVSLAYQNYDINYKLGTAMNTGTIASFIGYNTYITNYTIKTLSQTINANKLQGYWGFETLGNSFTGQAPAGATTVPNPIFATSPIPQGSCVVTAAFVDANGNPKPLKITGGETQDISVILSLSTNKSFEWNEITNDGLYEPNIGETVVDMGIRGLKPIIN